MPFTSPRYHPVCGSRPVESEALSCQLEGLTQSLLKGFPSAVMGYGSDRPLGPALPPIPPQPPSFPTPPRPPLSAPSRHGAALAELFWDPRSLPSSFLPNTCSLGEGEEEMLLGSSHCPAPVLLFHMLYPEPAICRKHEEGPTAAERPAEVGGDPHPQ